MRLPTIRRPARSASNPTETGAKTATENSAGSAATFHLERRTAIRLGLGALGLLGVGGGLAALLSNLGPVKLALEHAGLDIGVAMLFVPLCLLFFVLVFEVIRMAFATPIREDRQSSAPGLNEWQPGTREG